MRHARVAERIHPVVVAFPIALFAASVGALLAFIGTRDTVYYRAAMTAGAAGVTIAILGAIPAARATGVRHAVYAALTVGVFAASTVVMVRNWATKVMVDGAWQLDATVPLAIGVAGLVTLVIVGILGWAVDETQARRPPLGGTLLARHRVS